jgi:hypothetical protein
MTQVFVDGQTVLIGRPLECARCEAGFLIGDYPSVCAILIHFAISVQPFLFYETRTVIPRCVQLLFIYLFAHDLRLFVS